MVPQKYFVMLCRDFPIPADKLKRDLEDILETFNDEIEDETYIKEFELQVKYEDEVTVETIRKAIIDHKARPFSESCRKNHDLAGQEFTAWTIRGTGWFRDIWLSIRIAEMVGDLYNNSETPDYEEKPAEVGENEIMALHRNITAYGEKIARRDELIANLQAEIEHIKSQHQSLDSRTLDEADSKTLERLKREKRELNEGMKRLHEVITVRELSISSQASDIAARKVENDDLRAELERNQRLLGFYNNDKKRAEKVTSQTVCDGMALKSQVDGKDREIEALHKEIGDLEQQAIKMQDTIDALSTQPQASHIVVTVNKSKYEELLEGQVRLLGCGEVLPKLKKLSEV